MDLRESVRRYYGERISSAQDCCGNPQTAEIPSYGCGEPTTFANLKPGEQVLDLGSGAGLDCFRAAEAVGPSGQVIGVDMTPEMLERARQGALRLGLDNVEFREGYIESLPAQDSSIDVILSNCVVNLSTDKAKVFAEAYRVLRPGGRLLVSDILRNGERLAVMSNEGWCACEDGAEAAKVYEKHMMQAGFADITIDAPPATVLPGDTYSGLVKATKPIIRAATKEAMPELEALLQEAGLPLEGLMDTELFMLEHEGAVAGVAGLELYGEHALLRSLAVSPELQGRGYGRALLKSILEQAKERGARRVYGLTTTIPDWLVRLGFREITRNNLPDALHASAELKGACPASAQVFGLEL